MTEPLTPDEQIIQLRRKESAGLTEIKSPGATHNYTTVGTGDNAGDYDQELLGKIKIQPEPVTQDFSPGSSDGVKPTPENPSIKFNASSYVEQGVIVVDMMLQKGFDWLDRSTTLYKEDRAAMDYLIFREKNGLIKNDKDLSDDDRWLMSQYHKLQAEHDSRLMTAEEKQNIVDALKAMPWITDRLMTPQSQLAWALILYFGVRITPIVMNMFKGKETSPFLEAEKTIPPAPEHTNMTVITKMPVKEPVTVDLPK